MSLVTRSFLIIILFGLVRAGSAHVPLLGWDGGIQNRFQATTNLYQSAKEGSAQAQINLAKQLIDFDRPEFDAAALYWISQAADKDTEAKFLLGEFYRLGIGTAVDWTKAVTIYQELAEKDHAPAKSKLGQAYYFGYGVEANPKKAKTYFHEASKAGASEASNWLSILQGSNAENADELLHYRVQNEEAVTFYKQAMRMLYRKPVRDFDVREGLHRLRESASREYTPALNELGKICEQSLFGCENMVEACEWYKQAALLGDVYAQYHLAEVYYLGLGVEQDYVSSFAFATLASQQNHEEAINLKEETEAKLSDEEYHEARVLLDQIQP